MFIVQYRKIFFTISTLLVIGSIVSGLVFGLKLGTDFTGGSLLEVSYTEGQRPTLDLAKSSLASLDIGGYSLRPSGDNNFILRARELTPTEKTEVVRNLSQDGTREVKEERFNSVGPIAGASLKQKSYWAIGVVLLGIVLFVTFAFRKVSEPVSSWKYGLATIIALAHDVIVPTGIYILMGHYLGAEIDLLFVTAILAVLGYSVHDTIVVFDRVRENLTRNYENRSTEKFEETVGRSLSQTMVRSINTSLTIFFTLLALLIFGSEATYNFSLVLLIGVIVGTYSSIFIASPLLVTLEKFQKKN